MNEQKARQALERSSQKAKELLKDGQATKDRVGQVQAVLPKFDKLKDVMDDVKTMINLVKDFIDKEYTDIPFATIIAVLGGLLYLANPLDVVPDFLPGLGQVDDAAVILLCIRLCQVDLDNYKKWVADKNHQDEDFA